jgi:hypothetical protein
LSNKMIEMITVLNILTPEVDLLIAAVAAVNTMCGSNQASWLQSTANVGEGITEMFLSTETLPALFAVGMAFGMEVQKKKEAAEEKDTSPLIVQ